jgi:hypothetical protein
MHVHVWICSGRLTYVGRNCLVLIYLTSNLTEESHAPRHVRVLRAQLIEIIHGTSLARARVCLSSIAMRLSKLQFGLVACCALCLHESESEEGTHTSTNYGTPMKKYGVQG